MGEKGWGERGRAFFSPMGLMKRKEEVEAEDNKKLSTFFSSDFPTFFPPSFLFLPRTVISHIFFPHPSLSPPTRFWGPGARVPGPRAPGGSPGDPRAEDRADGRVGAAALWHRRIRRRRGRRGGGVRHPRRAADQLVRTHGAPAVAVAVLAAVVVAVAVVVVVVRVAVVAVALIAAALVAAVLVAVALVAATLAAVVLVAVALVATALVAAVLVAVALVAAALVAAVLVTVAPAAAGLVAAVVCCCCAVVAVVHSNTLLVFI